MSETIETKFDPTSLPKGAQKITEVVELAQKDNAYRCDVCQWWHIDAYRSRLIDIARQQAYGFDRRYWPRQESNIA